MGKSSKKETRVWYWSEDEWWEGSGGKEGERGYGSGKKEEERDSREKKRGMCEWMKVGGWECRRDTSLREKCNNSFQLEFYAFEHKLRPNLLPNRNKILLNK